MKKLLLLLLMVSLNSYAVEVGEDLKGDCADGVQKTRGVSSTSSSSSSSSSSSTSSADSASGN